MRTHRWPIGALAVFILTSAPPAAGDTELVNAEDARRHVGKRVTVCGQVVDTAYPAHVGGKPTFLNLEEPYPNQVFTVVIWGRNRSNFPQSPHEFYEGKAICVTGLVELYQGRPQIEVRSPDQIQVTDPRLDGDRFTYEERVVLKALLSFLGHETDYRTGEWDSGADEALEEFRERRGLTDEGDEGDEWSRTLRALAQSATNLTPDQRLEIVNLLLLNLAQREASTPRG